MNPLLLSARPCFDSKTGIITVTLPKDLAGGYYLVRPELLALHEVDKTPPNPQFYAGCAQIFLDSSATGVPDHTVSIPGYVDINNPSVLFNVWEPSEYFFGLAFLFEWF